MFHKVQDSFIKDYEDIKLRELKTVNDNSLCFGPYYLNEGEEKKGYYTIGKLDALSRQLIEDKNEGVKTGIRQWLTLMHEDEEKAAQRLKRLKTLNGNKDSMSIVDALAKGRRLAENKMAFPAYDVLSFLTIKNQQTKEESR